MSLDGLWPVLSVVVCVAVMLRHPGEPCEGDQYDDLATEAGGAP